MSGKRLQLKDLIPVTFTLVNDRDSRSLISKEVCVLLQFEIFTFVTYRLNKLDV